MKVVICYQLRPDVLTCGHCPWYTTDADAAEADAFTQKCQAAVWCLLLPQRFSSESSGGMSFNCFMYVGFSTATTTIFGQKQTPMLHLFTDLRSTFGRALCMAFWLGLLLPRWVSAQIYCVFLEVKLTETHGSGRKWLWLTLPSGTITCHLPLQRFLDRTPRACGLASHITGLPTNGFFLWVHFKALIYTSSVYSA